MADQLLTIPLVSPGYFGLNKAQATAASLSPNWAVEAQNCVFDSANRIASRKGWAKTAASNITGSPAVQSVAQWVTAGGSTGFVCGANNKLYSGLSSFTDITGSITITANRWQFVNFDNVLLGWQQGHTPIVWTGSGNATVITATAGSLPTGNCVCAGFGRIWALDSDGHTIKYSTLGSYTDWGSAGSGSIDMNLLWTHGTDTVIGIYAIGARLVVFGKRHIICFQDGSGSSTGLNPANIVVSDTIEGTGLVGRDTVQVYTTGDALYLSPHGVQSFARTIIQNNNPILSLDTQIKAYLASYTSSETNDTLKSIYSPEDRAYILFLPNSLRAFCYDTLQPLEDGRLRVFEWVYTSSTVPLCAALDTTTNNLYFGVTGNLGFYSDYSDNGNSYRYVLYTPRTTGAALAGPEVESRLKILKRLTYSAYTTVTTTVVFKWGFDFSDLEYSATVTLNGGQVPEYGTAEYGTNGVYNTTDSTAVAGTDYSQYGGSADLKLGRLAGASCGRWLQFGIEVDISSGVFALQELDATVKIGRMG